MKSQNARWLFAGGLLLVAAGVGLTVWMSLQSGKAAASDGNGPPQQGKAALGFRESASAKSGAGGAPAETVRVAVERRNAVLPLTGTLLADERSEVASNLTGIIAEVRVDRGSVVRRGDVLVQLDPTDFQNRLNEGLAVVNELQTRLGLDDGDKPFDAEKQPEVKMTRASLDLASTQVKRITELYQKKVISQEAFDQARTEFENCMNRYHQALQQVRQLYQSYVTAQTRLASLRKAVEDTTIRAPFDGVVAEKHVAPGEQVSNGPKSPKVATLVRINPLRLSLAVPQQDIGRVTPGQPVTFRVDSQPDRTFEGVVRYVSPVVTADTRTLVVDAVVPNGDGALRPGLFAKAELQLPAERVELYVPPTAVQRDGEAARVFVVDEGVARKRVVSLGETSPTRIEIRAGLDGSETIVAQAEKVRDGQPVR